MIEVFRTNGVRVRRRCCVRERDMGWVNFFGGRSWFGFLILGDFTCGEIILNFKGGKY